MQQGLNERRHEGPYHVTHTRDLGCIFRHGSWVTEQWQFGGVAFRSSERTRGSQRYVERYVEEPVTRAGMV